MDQQPRHPDPARQAAVIGSGPHAAVNLEIARRSLVLLRNDGTLPLSGAAKTPGRSFAPFAVRFLPVRGSNHSARIVSVRASGRKVTSPPTGR